MPRSRNPVSWLLTSVCMSEQPRVLPSAPTATSTQPSEGTSTGRDKSGIGSLSSRKWRSMAVSLRCLLRRSIPPTIALLQCPLPEAILGVGGRPTSVGGPRTGPNPLGPVRSPEAIPLGRKRGVRDKERKGNPLLDPSHRQKHNAFTIRMEIAKMVLNVHTCTLPSPATLMRRNGAVHLLRGNPLLQLSPCTTSSLALP